ncbi:hypothetical protein [Nocardia alni]|uniref:hypothetical protein n=1 Tax=Nocardia alni TaxID=2815723 RepID=UPI001C2215CA|nr:hypothetical protein [Nocardia alni]
MKFGKFAATALLAVATVGIAAGTASANPPVSTPPAPTKHIAKDISATGVDHGVTYHATLSDLSRKLTTTVTGGRFVMAQNGTEIDLKSVNGASLAKVPLTYKLDGSTVHVAQQISADGHQLVLQPKASAKEIGSLQPVDKMAVLTQQINKNIVGVVAGGVIGGLIGAVCGLFWLSWLTGPIGLLVGALAGGYIMGGMPFMNAVTQVV